MRFMNDYNIEQARRRFTGLALPNRLALVLVIDNLRKWADAHSDGWAYWPKPARAAARAMEHVDSSTFRVTEDISDADLAAAVRPIKSFCTRQVHEGHMTTEAREIILRAATN